MAQLLRAYHPLQRARGSQRPHGGLQPSLTPVPEDLMPSSDISTTDVVCVNSLSHMHSHVNLQ